MAKMKCAEAIVRFLEKLGTEYAFGLNGHGNWAFLDLIEHESKIKGIPVRSEDHAVHMADGYFRMKRQAPLPPVFTTVGPEIQTLSRHCRAPFLNLPLYL